MRLNAFGLPMLYLDADSGGNTGGASPADDDPGRDDPTAPGGRLHPDRLTAEHGDLKAALTALAHKLSQMEGENYQYRQTIRSLREQVPPEGAVVLSGEDVQAWEQYQGLGAPDEIRTQRQEYEALERKLVIGQAAAAAGYKPSVLERLGAELVIEMRAADGDENPKPVVVNGDGEATPLSDYATEHWADFLPALKAEEQGRSRRVIPQEPAGSPAPVDSVESFIQARDQAQADRRGPLDQE